MVDVLLFRKSFCKWWEVGRGDTVPTTWSIAIFIIVPNIGLEPDAIEQHAKMCYLVPRNY
jgi:hypothetical protein